MARLPRIVVPGHPHVIIHRGHNGQAVFADPVDRDSYLACLRESAREAGVAVHAFGLMPAELRLLVTPNSVDGLSRMMQSVGRRFVRLFNLRHQHTGTPFEGRFRSTVIEAATHFLACMRFVESPGLELAAARSSADGDDGTGSSSAQQHLGGCIDPLINEHPAFWALGNTPFEREAAYRRLVSQPSPKEHVAAILLSASNGWVLGSDSFSAWVGEVSGRRPNPAPRGRPRKSLASQQK